MEEELSRENIPIELLPEDFLWMHVKGGTQVGNVIDFAEKALKAGECRSIVWSGSGGGVPKTISCAEIMKRNHQELHQVTRLAYQKWDLFLFFHENLIYFINFPELKNIGTRCWKDSIRLLWQGVFLQFTFFSHSTQLTQALLVIKWRMCQRNSGQCRRRKRKTMIMWDEIRGHQIEAVVVVIQITTEIKAVRQQVKVD